MAEDYYKILGVPRNATQAEIQKAFRELARKYHPDLHPDDPDAKKKFQQIQRAFEVLNDPEKREMYDRYGASFETAGAGTGPYTQTFYWSSGPDTDFRTRGFEGFDFAEIFRDRFGPGADFAFGFDELFEKLRAAGARTGTYRSRTRAPEKGADIERVLEVPLPVAVMGGKCEFTFQKPQGGTATLSINIPAGIEEGQKIRLRGQGAPSPSGGPPGDLYLRVKIIPHRYFERKGDDLYVKVPVTLPEALFGAKVDIPTPKGTVSVRIPPGTSSGTKLRVRGLGVQREDGTAGDLYAVVEIQLPPHVDDSVKEAIKRLESAYPRDIRSELFW
ncbi:MAG: J domain-containing protein [Thermoguttaceae bacterium]|nr:J domain-containing protein [Thermoguttaceae bacterium]MDW8077802.1 J domain-containing protein [Thermoguttaceae bacterium]